MQQIERFDKKILQEVLETDHSGTAGASSPPHNPLYESQTKIDRHVSRKLIRLAKRIHKEGNNNRAKQLIKVVAEAYKHKEHDLLVFFKHEEPAIRGLAQGASNYLATNNPVTTLYASLTKKPEKITPMLDSLNKEIKEAYATECVDRFFVNKDRYKIFESIARDYVFVDAMPKLRETLQPIISKEYKVGTNNTQYELTPNVMKLELTHKYKTQTQTKTQCSETYFKDIAKTI